MSDGTVRCDNCDWRTADQAAGARCWQCDYGQMVLVVPADDPSSVCPIDGGNVCPPDFPACKCMDEGRYPGAEVAA